MIYIWHGYIVYLIHGHDFCILYTSWIHNDLIWWPFFFTPEHGYSCLEKESCLIPCFCLHVIFWSLVCWIPPWFSCQTPLLVYKVSRPLVTLMPSHIKGHMLCIIFVIPNLMSIIDPSPFPKLDFWNLPEHDLEYPSLCSCLSLKKLTINSLVAS